MSIPTKELWIFDPLRHFLDLDNSAYTYSLREESSQSNVHLTIKSVKTLSSADDEAE